MRSKLLGERDKFTTQKFQRNKSGNIFTSHTPGRKALESLLLMELQRPTMHLQE